MNKDEIYKIPPADNFKLAEMELTVERAWGKMTNEKQGIMLKDIQSLIERIKLDDKKIRQLEKMHGISWLGDEQKAHAGPDAIPPDIHDDTGEEGQEGEKGKRTAATLYEDRSAWDIPINCAGGGFVLQAFWQGREAGAREMEKEIHGK